MGESEEKVAGGLDELVNAIKKLSAPLADLGDLEAKYRTEKKLTQKQVAEHLQGVGIEDAAIIHVARSMSEARRRLKLFDL